MQYIVSSLTACAFKRSNAIPKEDMTHQINITLESVLRERGQSLYWLARATGISYTTLWRLTKDRAFGINFATLEKLCIALECQPGELIELTTGKKERKKRKVSAPVTVRRTSSH